jgi:rubredoxin
MYDEAVGDPDRNIPPGTLWSALPDDFTCGDCEVKKSETHMWQVLG